MYCIVEILSDYIANSLGYSVSHLCSLLSRDIGHIPSLILNNE